jgi:hypothetical protein
LGIEEIVASDELENLETKGLSFKGMKWELKGEIP